MQHAPSNPVSLAARRGALAAWYRRRRRDLPWRRTRDPWAILVSEAMLQQTRVEAVVDRFEAFLARFPSPAACAAAEEEDVLGAWAGLGYYRRARALREAARRIAGGGWPRDAAGLRALPGVGPYTAAAVASIAFGEPVPVVDGNVVRVLARVLALEADPTRGAGARAIRQAAGELLDPGAPGDANQALMELGALVCRPREARCAECPLAPACRARAAGVPLRWPRLPARPAAIPVVRAAALLVCPGGSGELLFRRVPEGAHNAGLLELPWVELFRGKAGSRARGPGASATARARAEAAFREAGLPCRLAAWRGSVRHVITRHRIRVLAWEGTPGSALARRLPPGHAWLAPAEALEAGVPAATRKLLELAGGASSPGRVRPPR